MRIAALPSLVLIAVPLLLCGLAQVSAAPMTEDELIQGIEACRETVRNWEVEYDYYTVPSPRARRVKQGSEADTVAYRHAHGVLDEDGRFLYSFLISDIVKGEWVPVPKTVSCWNGREYRSLLAASGCAQVNVSHRPEKISIVGARLLFSMMLWSFPIRGSLWTFRQDLRSTMRRRINRVAAAILSPLSIISRRKPRRQARATLWLCRG